jgi:predicted Zn-dependent peptidase
MVKILESQIHHEFFKGPIKRSLFSNGTTYLFHEFPGMNGAVVNITFVVGSQNENKNQHGITHVIEHMLFKEGQDSNTIYEIEELGGDINAYTSKENTTYELNCLAKSLKEILPKYLKLILDPHFIEDDLKKEKKVIKQEIREDLDDHETLAHEYLFSQLYPEPLGHPIAGKIKDVESFTLDEIKKYHQKYFRPERMIISICAGEDFSDFDNELCQMLPEGNKKPIRLSSQDVFYKVPSFNKVHKKDIKNSYVTWGMSGLSLDSSFYYDLVVLDTYLCDGMSSLLFKELREKKPLMYSLESTIYSFEKSGHYTISIQTERKNERIVLKKVKSLISELHFSNDQALRIEKIKERILDTVNYSFDSLSERLEFLTQIELYNEKQFTVQRVYDQIHRVSPERLNNLVKKLRQLGEFSLIFTSKK